MTEVILEERRVYGLSTRTTITQEMDPSQAKIGPLWQRFDQEVPVDYQNGERVYGVYSNYESDATGAFSAVAAYDGKKRATLEEVTLPSGKYLLFEAEVNGADDAARTKTVIQLWTEVWEYFSKQPKYTRAFQTDFDFYNGPTHIEVYVSIL